MDDVYYYGWVLDVDDDVCVRGLRGVYITFRDALCWMLAGFFLTSSQCSSPFVMVSLMPLVWFDATLHGYESWLLGIYRRPLSLLLFSFHLSKILDPDMAIVHMSDFGIHFAR
jgi:hypothetical protein